MLLSPGAFLAIQWCEGVAFHLDSSSRLLITQAAWLGSHQCRDVNCKLKLLDKFLQVRHKGPCKKMNKWLGLYLPCLIHSELEICLITTNGPLHRNEGHFQPGNRYSSALSNHQISNLRGGHELLQHRAAMPDLWNCTLQAHPGMPKCDWEMLDEFSGPTKVTIYPCNVILLQMVAVLAFLISGLTIAGWQGTQLEHKQLNNTNWVHPS